MKSSHSIDQSYQILRAINFCLNFPRIRAVYSLFLTGKSSLHHSSSRNAARRIKFNELPLNPCSDAIQAPVLGDAFNGLIHTDGKARNAASGLDLRPAPENYFSQQIKRGHLDSHDTFSKESRIIFSCASNLTKEGMDVDGSMYVDASVGLYLGHSTLGAYLSHLDDLASELGSSRADKEYGDVRQSPVSASKHSARPLVAGSNCPAELDYTTEQNNGLKSEVLGFSTRKHSSLKGDKMEDTDAFTAINQNLLTSLIQRYPEGKLFTFDHHGPISHKAIAVSPKRHYCHMKHKLSRHKARKRAEIIRLLSVFPGARQIFFVPLCDSIFECFVGSFT